MSATEQDALNTQMFLTGYIAGALSNVVVIEPRSQQTAGGTDTEPGVINLRTQSGLYISIIVAVSV